MYIIIEFNGSCGEMSFLFCPGLLFQLCYNCHWDRPLHRDLICHMLAFIMSILKFVTELMSFVLR